jgi:predicted Zn finger-like uncharacterized protein
MVVTCPNCGSRYAVDPLAIGPAGRTVQCARCDHRWFQMVEGTTPPPDVVIRPTSAGVSAALPAVIPPRPVVAWRRLIAVAVVVVVLVAATLFAFRREIASMVSYEARASTPVQMTDASAPSTTASTASSAPSATASSAATALAGAVPSPPSVVRTTTNSAGSDAGRGAAAPPPQAPRAQAARPNIEVDLASSKIDVVDGRYVVRGQLVNNGKAAGSTTLLRLTFKKNDDVLGERSFPMVEGPLSPGSRTSFSQTFDDPPSGTTDIVPVVE